MPDITYYGNLILKNEPVIIHKTSELMQYLHDTALEIYECPKRNSRGRSFEEVLSNTKKMVIEIALEKRTGFIRNPKKFDKRDKHSYAYDNIDVYYYVTFDCIYQYRSSDLTYFKDSVKTKFKHVDIIDYIVSATVNETADSFKVFFTRVIDAKTFELCTKIRDGVLLEYNDNAALKRGYVIKYEEEYVS